VRSVLSSPVDEPLHQHRHQNRKQRKHTHQHNRVLSVGKTTCIVIVSVRAAYSAWSVRGRREDSAAYYRRGSGEGHCRGEGARKLA